MNDFKKKICVFAATPLTIHFFFKPHILALSKNFDVTLIVNLKNDSYLPPLDLPVRIIDIAVSRKMAPFLDISILFALINFFKRNRYDLLVTIVPKAGLLGMLAGAFNKIPKRLHIFQGEVWANRRGFGRRLLKSCDAVTAFLATNVLAVSNSEKLFLESEGVARHGKIEVLGKGSIGGVNLARFSLHLSKREQARSDLDIPVDAFVLIFMGRLVADKGVRELVIAYRNALLRHPDVWLLLVGPDEEGQWKYIQESLGSAISQVRYRPYTDNPQNFMAAADVLCLPSHREGFGVVIIEAAGMGIPAIGSRIYGISDAIIDGVTGILFDCGDAEQLQGCIEKLYGDPELRMRLGSNARRNAEHFFDDKQVQGLYIAYIDSLLNG